MSAKGKYLAMVSTTVETSNPEAELRPALDLLGEIEEKFLFVTDLFEPNDEGDVSKVCCTQSLITNLLISDNSLQKFTIGFVQFSANLSA